jgi:RHS repeat-associated protein
MILFQRRDYLKEGAIYDYRNRFYHPGLARFLQPDPIDFKGDAANLYRFCNNDAVNRTDPIRL